MRTAVSVHAIERFNKRCKTHTLSDEAIESIILKSMERWLVHLTLFGGGTIGVPGTDMKVVILQEGKALVAVTSIRKDMFHTSSDYRQRSGKKNGKDIERRTEKSDRLHTRHSED